MSKVLKPYTIIPAHLYVQRDADRQITDIIRDMGRPGYVLVSRQMGKTNLLLNAKRRLETEDDLFVYVDLSNPYESAKSCFENIIDTAIDTNSLRFDEIAKTISERRLELKDTPAHKQHTSELRLLLNSIPGKLVIILDEIDALTKTQYSDQIFAQIRSVYFSRVNFPELERLTYILSGVIEPTEIIKDPKISPFNIGQKIFLNDFNRVEFEQFVDQSNLTIASNIRDRIFYWTNGNPRMSWDVCAEVEDRLSDSLSAENIDRIVQNMYLTTFDRPPIDNIRELVKNDREIRKAIVEIGYKKGKQVSDKLKNKLYLSGIVNYDESDVQIKNAIINGALNSEWIVSLEEEEKGLVGLAVEHFHKENYTESLEIFERYLSENEFREADLSLCYFYMGFAYYKNSAYPKAIDCWAKTLFDPIEDSKLYYRILNLKGLAHFFVRNYDESRKCFRAVIDSGRKDEIYVRGLINFGSTSLSSDRNDYKLEAVKIFQDIIDEVGFNKEKIKDSILNEIKSVAHHNLGKFQYTNGETESAFENYTKALELGTIKARPTVILALLKVSNSSEDRVKLLVQLIDLIATEKVAPSDVDPDRPGEFSFDDFRNLVIMVFTEYREDVYPLLEPHLSLLGENSVGEHLYELALFSINVNENVEAAIKILELLLVDLTTVDETDVALRFKAIRILAYFTKPSRTLKHHFEFIRMFYENVPSVVENIDFDIFANAIYSLSESKRNAEALSHIGLINSVKSSVSDNSLINYLVIYHLELNVLWAEGRNEEAIDKAREIVALAEDEKITKQKSNLLGDTGLETIKKNAENVIGQRVKSTPEKSKKGYGRNDLVRVRYKDGTIRETKFKKVTKDLSSGECILLN